MARGQLFFVYLVHYSRHQTNMIAQLTEHPVQQGHSCSLAVGAGDANEFQLLRGMTVPVGSHLTQRLAAVGNLDIGNGRQSLRQLLADHSNSTFLNSTAYIAVAVNLGAALCHK